MPSLLKAKASSKTTNVDTSLPHDEAIEVRTFGSNYKKGFGQWFDNIPQLFLILTKMLYA